MDKDVGFEYFFSRCVFPPCEINLLPCGGSKQREKKKECSFDRPSMGFTASTAHFALRNNFKTKQAYYLGWNHSFDRPILIHPFPK
jgi:hypothetical protein